MQGWPRLFRPQPAHDDPKPGPIIANHVDQGDRNGAKLHFAEKQIKLSVNKENEKPLLVPRTTARRKGSRNMEKRILKAKSPGKKLRDQRMLNQFKAKRRLSFGFAAADNCLLEEKGSGTEDSGTDRDLDFSECERMDELGQTKTETVASDSDAINNLEELLTNFYMS